MKKIDSWEDADGYLAYLGDLERKREQAKIRAEQRIAAIREELSDTIALLIADIDQAQEALKAWVSEHRADMLPLKSRQMMFGTVGFRDSVRLAYPKCSETLIEKLKALGLKGYIRIKEEVARDLIFAHREKIPLKELGIKERFCESFFAEPKDEKVPEKRV